MDSNIRKRAPPLAAIYNLRRSCTMPFCRITGKSHSMDEHHYVPCLDDFPKFERHSGCRITEKNQYFKDYKFAYPILDLDGTARMVTEHDFHCRITSKYRAMAGHKYIYPVLGATTDKTIKDLVSVVEADSMRDVLIPREVEMIVKGGVEDVLKMKEGEYLFIHSGEGTIIPAAMKEILGKRGVRQGRRHTLPAGLEGGAASDIEEFRRSLKIKMLSEIKNPPPELSEPPPVTDVFDKIQEEVEVLKDIRKSRPKRPGKHGHKVEEVSQKRIKTDDRLKEMAQKENIIHESKEEDVPPPKLSRLEKYKMQFSAFESNDSNNESGNRLTLVGAFDENDVVELDFGEPMSVEVTHVHPGKISTAVISDVGDSSHLSSQTVSVSETLKSTITSESAQGKNDFKTGSASKSIVENSELSVGDKSGVLSECELMSVESDKLNNNFEAVNSVAGSMSNSLINEATSLFERNKPDSKDLKEGDNIVLKKEEKIERVQFQQKEYAQATENLVSNHVNGKLNSDRVKVEHHTIPTEDHQMYSNGFQHEMIEIDELEEPSFKKTDHAEKKICDDVNVNEPVNSEQSQELIAPKKLSHIPQSNLSKNLMSELKSKLKKKVVETEADSTIPTPQPKDSSPALILDNKCSKEKLNETNFEEVSDNKQTGLINAKRNLSVDDKKLPSQTVSEQQAGSLDNKKTVLNDIKNSPTLNQTVSEQQAGSLDNKKTVLNDIKNSPTLNQTIPALKKTDPLEAKKTLLNGTEKSPIQTETVPAMKQADTLNAQSTKKTDPLEAKRIVLNGTEKSPIQTETVPAMKQADTLNAQSTKKTDPLEAKRIVLNGTEKSPIQTETVPAMKQADTLNVQSTKKTGPLEAKRIVLNGTEKSPIRAETIPMMKHSDSLDSKSNLLNNLKHSPIHPEIISSMKETDSFDAKRTLLNDSEISTTHTEDISTMKQTDSVDAKMISLNGSTTQTETVSAMKQKKTLEAKRSLINDGENSHGQTEITKRRIEKVEDLGWHEVEHKDDKISSRLLQDANIGKYETFTSENGKNENDFVESSYKKKIKLEDDIIEAKLKQTASQMKQTVLEDLSMSEKSQKVYFYSNGVSGMKEKDISVNEVSSKISVDGGDWNEMNGNLAHNISKINRDMNRFESAAKGTGDSKNRSLKFSIENLDSDTETYSSPIDKTEINASFRASDIKTETSKVESISKTSVDFDSEKTNSSERKHFETVDEVHYNGNCRGKMSRDGHLTGEVSEFAFSQGKREGVILINNQISSSFSSEVNNLSRLDNKMDLSCSVQNKNESVVTEMLSNDKSRNLGMSHSEMKFDSQTETLMTVDSPNPFATANNAPALAKPQGTQTELPVASKLASQEPADANIPLDTAADRKADAETRITSDGTEGNEKQCQGIDVYVAIMDFKPMGSDEEAVAMKEGQRVEVIDASKPRRWLVRTVPINEGETPQEGWVPACYLEKSTAFETLSSYVVTEADMDPKELEALQNREAIVKELVETEEDFAKDMQFVVENYYKQMDNPRLPKEFRDRKGSVFGNFKDICDFHNNVLMKGVNYHANQPTKLGKTFLRLERDFDMHANYCWNEARAQRLLQEGALRDFFDDHSKMLDDDKLLTDHLKLPIQRLNDYQLLLKELIKYSSRLGEDTADLQKALDFIHSINTRTKDLQYIQVIEGCKGDLLKIGRILKHEVFDVCEGSEVSASERYVFLFKGRVFVTEKRCTGDKEAYHVTNLFRLQDVEMIENVDGDALKIVFKSHKKSRPGFPLSFRARSAEQKAAWIKELQAANQVVEDLGDLEPRLEHPLVASDEQLAEKPNDAIEQALEEKPAPSSLKRQDSVKKPTKTPDSSAPQTPTDTDGTRPSLKKQESIKKSKRKPSDASPPETPTEILEKPPKLLRQDSKKGKTSDSSAPETPTEASDKRPKLSRQDSKKSKAADTSAPDTPVESSEKPPPLSRQESKKSKASDTSAPETPVESTEKPPPLSRQESKKSKASDTSAPETPVESSEKPPLLSRQDSKKSKASDTSAPETPVESTEKPPPLSRQESKKSKASDTSAPETPVESTEKPPPLSRQESKKSKASDTSAPETPVESIEKPPPLSRQESKKSKASDTSAPETPVESTEKPPPLSRQESKKSEASAPETPTESKEPKLTRQDSKKSKASDTSAPQTPTDSTTTAPALTRQDSVKKKQKKQSVTEKEAEKVVPIAEEKEKPSLKKQESVSEKKTEEDTKLRRQDSLSKKEAEDKKKPKQDFDPMDKPRFSKTLRGVTCNLGETAVLECETEGSPVPSVTWLLDNQKLEKSARLETSSVGQKHSLTIKEACPDDGGLYTVVALNSKGQASCSAPLNLKLSLLGLPKEDSRPTTPGGTVLPHAPVFKVKLNKETQLLEGTSVRFELVVRGHPEPEVKFLKDGKVLKLDDRVRVVYESKEVFELILDHVVAKDAGTYTIIATNVEGEDKTVGNLSVVKHKDVFKGLELEEVEREPTPRPKTPKFRWFKNGEYFEANERFQVIFNEEEDSLALMFQHVTPEDAGLYTCVASTSSGSKIACSAELTVQGVIRQVEAPSIKADLTDAEATEGGSAMLELKITGYPKPKVTWFHKGKEVSTGGRIRFLFADEETFTLVIKNVTKNDGGKYSVKATNEMGEAESTCNLTVLSAPSFVKGLKDMSVMADELLKFEVEIDGNPAPEVKWYKDGKPLAAGDRIKIVDKAGKQSLEIPKCKPTDSGSYSCVITNDLGNQAEFSNVVVKASPTFVKGMENVKGLEGDTLKFNVEINGNPKPTVKWLKDGKELSMDGHRIKVTEEETNVYTLTIQKATAADVGAYTCEIRNEHGLKASSGNLNIKMKPEFIKKLSDMEANEGDLGLIMNTTVKGYPPPTVKWYQGENSLESDKSYIITSENDSTSHTLKVKKVSRSNAGKYTCEATNEMGQATTSGVISVNVLVKKPEIEQELKPTQLVEGKPGKLVAKVSGEPKPKVTWLKDGKPIALNGRFSMEEAEDGTVALLINNVTPDDAGLYSLVVSNDEGEATSQAPVSTIPPGKKPEFIKELEKVDLLEGQPLRLEAKVTGKPTSIKWQKDGEDLSDDGRVQLSESPDGTIALTIEKAKQSDAGKYTVIASNAEGKARSAALVQVQEIKKPELEGTLEPLTIKDGETGELKVKASGIPKPTVTWLKDGKVLRPTNRVESIEEPDGTLALVIKNARPEDAGQYSVLVQNPLGEAKSAAPVLVEQAPTFQKPLEPVNVVEGYPAKLEAKLAGSPPPEIKWLKDGEEIIPDNLHIREVRSPDGTVALLIDDCKPEDAAKYSLVAKNPLGESSSSGKLGVSGKDSDAPPSKPCFVTPLPSLTVKEGEPIRFEAEISGNPLPDISWTVNDRPLTPADNTLITFDGEKAILEIRSSTPDHIGTYQCKLSNRLGEANSEGSVSVQEKSAPHFIQRLNDFNGFINQPLRLSCKVTGYPEPEVDWYFNGDLISAANPKYHLSKVGEMHTLAIPSCTVGDNGVYECKAKNPVGEDHTRAAVNISDKVEKGEPPFFLKKIGDNEVMEGMTAKFTACITGSPTPEVAWFKDGQPLEPSPRHKMELESTGILRLIVREVEEGDYGDYSVTLTNCHGSATCSAKLCPDSLDPKYLTPIGDQFVDFDKFKKTGIPVPLSERPRIIRMDDTSLTLGWKPSVPTSPRVPVTYQLEMAKHPDGEWTPYKTGLKDTLCDVRDLRPGQDYKFQIRVENKHGVSDPGPYVTAHRSKIYEPPTPADFKPRDFEIEHPPFPRLAAAPQFVRREEDAMYGVRGHPVTIEFWVYGQPEPKITWFKDESQIGKDRFDFLQDRNGKLCVFIGCMNDDFVGTYTCLAVNDEGEATMKIKLRIAEPPVFLERLDETTAMSRRSARMQCRVTGLPYPKIKWFRDWHPLYESERVKILWEEPDKCTLFISNLITRDNALYSCTATNIAGTATSSASLNVEDSEDMFDYKTYCRPIPVRPRTKLFEDFYDIGDELGRGTQAITYHAVKRDTGDPYAAKSMHGKGKLKEFMKAEMDIMNQLCHPKLVRLRDAFETKDTLTLVTDIVMRYIQSTAADTIKPGEEQTEQNETPSLTHVHVTSPVTERFDGCGGGELLNSIIKRGGVTERGVANYVKQILEGMDYMHSRYVGHLGLTIGDVMLARVNGDDIRFGDFSLAARLLPGKEHFLEYGHPEFVAPEIANKQPASCLSDMWSVGVITYLLLSGISPFLGEHDRETLTRVQQGKINFVEEAFAGVSDDAKDFMSKLLVFDPKGRLDVKGALQHRWIKYYLDKPSASERLLNNLDRLRDYQKKWRDWYSNASCKRFFRRRTLESCFHHPSKMIYPPGECYTPSSSPEPVELERTHAKPSHFDDVTFKQKINREDIDFRSESSYQNGPDTYLLQLRDTDFPMRLRQYLRVGASISPSLNTSLREKHWGDSPLVIRERRKFVDVMDEEIDDERKGLTKSTVPRRLYHEIGTLGFAREQMEQLKKEVWKDRGSREIEIGLPPFFREKIRNTSMKENDEVVFTCYAVGTPKVNYTWFRNDGILLESSRIVVTELKDGRCELRIHPTRAYDIGVYKCVARNMHGVACCRARLKLGSKPGRPEKPVARDASDTEIYITWAVPRDEGNCTTLGYALEFKKADESDWKLILNNIEHEYFVVRNLEPSTFYQFRVQAYNKFGWGEHGVPTEPITTKAEGAPKVKVSPRRKYQQEFTERTPDYELHEFEIPVLDYSQESNPVPLVESDPLELYRIVSEMDRGRFSCVLNVWVKESNTSAIAKVIQKSKDIDGRQEYEIMKSLVHERVVTLLSASHHQDKTVLIMEKLSGVDVMSYLALRHDYNEELVVTIIKQVLEALEYLHFREICCIELQPDNVVMVNLRDSDIKLVDFGCARFVPKSGAKVLVEGGTPEYLAPEVLKNDEISSFTDVWSVGVLTYILLSGVSPFAGKDEEDTVDNVKFVRYHFDNMLPDTTSEVTRFLLNIFKQCPIKRLTLEECLEHKWLAPSEYMIMKRESARFLPDRLAAFAKRFHAAKYEAMDPEMLTSLGMSSSKSEMKVDDFL